MKYLIFSKLNRNHFLFLSYFIISILKELVNKNLSPGNDANYTIDLKYIRDIVYSFNKYYINSLSDFLSIIPIIIIKVRSKSISTKNQESSTRTEASGSIKFIYTDVNKKRTKRILKLSILVSIFNFLALYLNLTFSIIMLVSKIDIIKVKISSNILFNIISKYVLSILILHSPIYKHHYISLVINLLFLIGLIIYDVILIKDATSYLDVLKMIIIIILFSVEDAISKILLSLDSISPHIYLFYRGIFLNILSLFYAIIFIFVGIPDENGNKSCVFLRFWKIYENKLNILLSILLLFITYLFNLNVFLIIDKFSPIHFAVASILENLGSLLISLIYSECELGEFFIKLALSC